ncbi:MAG: hypothetical protein RL414_431 [Actinomycetota bacterium]
MVPGELFSKEIAGPCYFFHGSKNECVLALTYLSNQLSDPTISFRCAAQSPSWHQPIRVDGGSHLDAGWNECGGCDCSNPKEAESILLG